MASLSVSAIESGGSFGFSMTFSGIVNQHLVEQYAYQIGGTIYNSYNATEDIYGLSCGATYNCLGAYKKAGVWYQVGTGTNYTTNSCPPPPTYPSSPSWTATSTVNSITTYVTFGANTHHVNVYLPGATPQTQTLYSNGNVTHGNASYPLTANTNYTLYIQAWDASETYGSGSQSYIVKTAGARPANFSGWGIPVESGQPCVLSAAKWNEFTAKINAFRVYKGLGNYGFTTVLPGWDYAAWIFNQAVSGMAGLGVTVPAARTGGQVQDISAAWINSLVTALNSVT